MTTERYEQIRPKTEEQVRIDNRLFCMMAFGYDPENPPGKLVIWGGFVVTTILCFSPVILTLAAVCVVKQIP